VGTNREVAYVEEKGNACANHWHRRNQTIMSDRFGSSPAASLTSKAS
jgi:hypothetical protein